MADEVESTDYNAALKVHKELIAELAKDIAENKLFKKSDAMKKKREAMPSFPGTRTQEPHTTRQW